MKVEKIIVNDEEIEFNLEVPEEYFEINPMLENTLDLSFELENIKDKEIGDSQNV